MEGSEAELEEVGEQKVEPRVRGRVGRVRRAEGGASKNRQARGVGNQGDARYVVGVV